MVRLCGPPGDFTGLAVIFVVWPIVFLLGKGFHKGGRKLTGKAFCQEKYEECLGRHPYLTHKSRNTPPFCERQILRNYYCKTRLPDKDKNIIANKRGKDRSLGGGDDDIIFNSSVLTVPNETTKEFYIEFPLHNYDTHDESNSTEEISVEN